MRHRCTIPLRPYYRYSAARCTHHPQLELYRLLSFIRAQTIWTDLSSEAVDLGISSTHNLTKWRKNWDVMRVEHFILNPVILPCSHNICFPCVLSLQVSGTSVLPASNSNDHTQQPGSAQYDYSFDFPEADRLSAFSDGDSGVSFAGGYAPSQASGSSSSSGASSGIGKNGYAAANPDTMRISCPQCHRAIFLDEKGSEWFPSKSCLGINCCTLWQGSKHDNQVSIMWAKCCQCFCVLWAVRGFLL